MSGFQSPPAPFPSLSYRSWNTVLTGSGMCRFPPVRACLFDMDGLLIDTEDIYTKCNNVILHEYGKPSLPWKIKAQLQGRPGPEVSRAAFNPCFYRNIQSSCNLCVAVAS